MSLTGEQLLTAFSEFLGDLWSSTTTSVGSTTTLTDSQLQEFGDRATALVPVCGREGERFGIAFGLGRVDQVEMPVPVFPAHQHRLAANGSVHAHMGGDVVQADADAAMLRAAREGELDHITIPPEPIDVLAQQVVA